MAEIIRQLEVGQTFQPFEGMTLPKLEVDLNDTDLDILTPLESSFEFNGIIGKLQLTAELGADYSTAFALLGKTRLVQSIEGERNIIEEVPLELGLIFNITSVDEYYLLRKYSIELDLDGKPYYLRCGGVSDSEAVKYEIDMYGGMELMDPVLSTDNLSDRGIPVLPYDIDKLATIKARIIEKEIPLLTDLK